jgi:U3 small nucleolar RNA-associated protein 20
MKWISLLKFLSFISYDIALFDKYVLQKRLVVFLRAFASISGPQQLVKHRLLEMIFISFLNHQEVQIVQLAFSCLLRYKPAYLVPYSEFLKTVLRKGGLREGLLNFSEKIKEEPIDSEHYKNLVPIVSRILFGRLIARGIEKKSSKDSPAARRAAILSFLSMLCRNESDLFPFFYLMSRSFLPKDQTTRPVEIMEHTEKMKLLTILSSVDKVDLSNVRGPVFEGILNLMEAVISQLGVRATSFVPQMTSITLAIMKNVEVKKAINVEESSVDEESAEVDNRNIRFGPVRTLTLRRLSDLFGSYASRVDFRPYADELWSPLQQALTMLPEMAMNSEGAPALLVLLQTLSSDPSLVELLEMKEEAISAVIQCISSASSTAVIVVCLIFINNILDENKFPETLIPLLLIRFTDRLEKSSEIPVKPKSSFIKTKVESTKRRELDILCRVSELVRASSDTGLDIESSTVDRLCNLLVSFIQPDQMSQDADKLNILGILESLVPSTSMLAKEMTFTKAAQLLAPYKAKPINSSLQVRHAVSSLLFSLSKTEPRYEKVARKVQRLSAIHGKRIDEKDFDLVIPELTALGNDTGETEWQSLCKTGKDTHKPSLLVPVINACYHFLYDEDGVISRAAYNAIVTLVRLIGRKVIGQTGEQRDTACEAWVKLAESAIIPIARSGLNGVDASARRRFIMIISESARAFHSHPSAHLYGDLFQLVRDDNPDLDFFLGITHVQLHRRSRALQRLRKVLNQATEEDSTLSFSAQSMSNILLVLAQHPIYECKTKAEESFATEAIATVGTISRLLSWSKYNHLLWTALNQFERHAEQDRFLIGMICAVIDGFHFDVTTANEEDERNHEDDAGRSSVWRALEKRIIPKLEELLTKEKVDKSGNKVKMIRPTVALAMLKLFKRFPKDFFESRLHRLLAVLCDSLRNRDSDARDIARTTMAKVVVSMDMVYLGDVIRELAITLNEGYKLHVRSAVLHTILLELLETYKHSGANRPNDEGPIPFDQCVAGMMDLIQEDLFGEAQERKESRDTQVRYVKEAGGSKSVHAIEMICRLIVFKPSDSNCPGKISTIHCIVSPLLERLRLPDADASVIRKIREILTRIVVGLANNPSVKFEELLPFVYATVQPFVGDDAIATVVNEVEDDNDDDAEDEEKALYISGSNNAAKKSQEKKNAQGKVIEWRPSTLKASQNMKDARLEKAKDKKVRRTVQDGANAPKLTGSSRHTTISASTSKSLNDPSTISAVIFGLNLLNACLKKIPLSKLDDFQSRMDPFLPLLTACACYCKDNDVALTSLRCLMSFLRFPLPSLPKCSKALGSQTLKLLTSSGGSSNKNHDMTQACFKTLTYLIGNDAKDIKGSTEIVESDIVDGLAEKALSKGLVMPLDSNQMEVLISFLQISIAESEQHNPALALIKAILSRRYISPEFYDLMETMLKLTVRSQKQSLRQVRHLTFPGTNCMFCLSCYFFPMPNLPI